MTFDFTKTIGDEEYNYIMDRMVYFSNEVWYYADGNVIYLMPPTWVIQ